MSGLWKSGSESGGDLWAYQECKDISMPASTAGLGCDSYDYVDQGTDLQARDGDHEPAV